MRTIFHYWSKKATRDGGRLEQKPDSFHHAFLSLANARLTSFRLPAEISG
jgi:hypothetical protein